MSLIVVKYNFIDQITPIEKDLFWMGFDKSYKDVPLSKPYLETKWTKKETTHCNCTFVNYKNSVVRMSTLIFFAGGGP